MQPILGECPAGHLRDTFPNGRRFTYTTLHRILKRLGELGLTKGPRSVSEGASARRYRPRHATSRFAVPHLSVDGLGLKGRRAHCIGSAPKVGEDTE
jgi:hypothetical protein